MNHMDINKLLHGKTPINVSIDREARAVYFKLSDDEVLKTTRINSSLSVDYGKNDEVIGVEIIRIKKIEVLMKKAFKDISSSIPSNVFVAN